MAEQRTIDHDQLKEQNLRLRECLGFFASVIKSGEPWTQTCQEAYDKALADGEPKCEEFSETGYSESQYVSAAREKWVTQHNDELEIDDDPEVSMGSDPGAWVQAWVWVSDSDIDEDPAEGGAARDCRA